MKSIIKNYGTSRSFISRLRLTVLTTILLLTAFSRMGSAQVNISQDDKVQMQKLIGALQIINMAYVDSINLDELVSDAIIQTLKELDPHSAYIPKEEVERVNEPLEGSFEGIGVTFQLFRDTILVVAPVPGGPSDKLGIMAGDKIIRIDGQDATGDKIDNQWVMDHLRGAKGTTVLVSILRQERKGLIEYTITRDKIPLNSIDATFMAAPGIGYIRLNRFSKTSIEEFRGSLSRLRELGMSDLILDLRGNSGGFLSIAVELSDEFLEPGKLIVYTEGEHSMRQDFSATATGGFEKGRLVVLIDEGSASASEIVSGAIQDWDRGIIIGRRSFGKGLVQRPFTLNDGSQIRLTTARYYTPTGRSIQRPYENGSEDYYMDLQNRFKHGEMVHPDSIHFPDSLKYMTPGGRIVYGGGGIMPDVFTPWDSSWYSDYYAELRRKNVLNDFTVQYVNDHRVQLMSRYTSVAAFKTGFQPSKVFLDEFFKSAETAGIKYDEKGWESSGETIQYQLKALLARNLWDIGAYYQVIADIDDGYRQAVEVLQKGVLFGQLGIR